jgi:hypothetical protein
VIHRVGTIRADFDFEDGVGACPADAFDPNTDVGQVFGETVVVHREINKVANPIGRKFHEISYQLSAVSQYSTR